MNLNKVLSYITYTLLIVSLVVATFIEKFNGAKESYSLVFGSLFTTLLWSVSSILMIIELKKYTWNYKNLSFISIHIALLFILLGALTTRYVGNTGYIHLKKGETVAHYVQTNSKDENKIITPLAFELTLNDFKIENYIGSKMPSSYRSFVTIRNKSADKTFDQEIYMNNPLNYQGFRIYQASFDNQGGVFFSVNNDPYGIRITYTSYLLLILGILFSLLDKHSLIRKLLADPILNTKHYALILLLASPVFSLSNKFDEQNTLNPEICQQVGELWVQDGNGRIKPLNTLAANISIKLTKKKNFKGLTPEQFFLGIIGKPNYWNQQKLFYIKSDSIQRTLGIKGSYASLFDLLDHQGNYKLQALHMELLQKSSTLNKLENELLQLGEKLNIYFKIQAGDYFKVFPDKQDLHKAWYAPSDSIVGLERMDSLLVKKGLIYFFNLLQANKLDKAHELIAGIENYQTRYAAKVLPSQLEKKIEIAITTLQPFSILFKLYATIGLVIIILFYISLLSGKSLKHYFKFKLTLLLLLSIVHLLFLAARSYVAGHAPFSNGYEMMLSLSLIGVWLSLLLRNKSIFIVGVGALFSGLCLLVAYFSHSNPEITKLVPILKSNWLSIHVATIIIGYTFAGLACLSAIFNLFMLLFINPSNQQKLNIQFQKLSLINRILIWFSIYFMILGITSGAVWANESWGNYWSWDPKETWALITLLVYTVLAHQTTISNFKFNLLSVVSFSTVLITYFGVNYYFGGKHAYGGGEVGAALIPILITSAFFLLFFAIVHQKSKRYIV